MEKIGGIWHSLTINHNQIKSIGAHRDFRNATNSLNCVVPYEDWTGGDLLLWELRKQIELKEGEALFFQGSSILYNCWNISNGSRNSINLFTHDRILEMYMKNTVHSHPPIECIDWG